MAKINLLTINWDNNNGALLQTYATKKILESLGHEVVIVNYAPESYLRTRRGFVNKMRNLTYCIKDFRFRYFKYHIIGSFTPVVTKISYKDLPAADLYMVGSDQVWNRSIMPADSLQYFFDFLPDEVKRISFSSSIGQEKWQEDQEYTDKVISLLNKFNAVAVRESTGVEICKDVFNIPAVRTVDPVLVYGQFERFIKNRPKHQIFSFLFTNTKETAAVVDFVSRELKMNVVTTRGRLSSRFRTGPKIWMNYIYNSEFLIVSSFHALAFCVMFHKQFIVLVSDPRKFTRLASLLRLLDLEYRYVPDLEYLKENKERLLFEKIDYDRVDRIIAEERSKSWAYLKSAIAGCVEK